MKQNTAKIRKLVLIAMLGALSGVLMLFKMQVPFMPPFYTLDVGDLPAMFAAFFLGPVAGAAVAAVKLLIKLVQQGSDTLLIGELSNFVCSICYVVPAGLIYRYRKSKQGAVLGMATGLVCVTVAAMFTNAYIMLPLYAGAFQMNLDDIVSLCQAVNPAITSVSGVIFFATMPFNVLKFGLVSVLTFLIYKHVAKVLRSIV